MLGGGESQIQTKDTDAHAHNKYARLSAGSHEFDCGGLKQRRLKHWTRVSVHAWGNGRIGDTNEGGDGMPSTCSDEVQTDRNGKVRGR